MREIRRCALAKEKYYGRNVRRKWLLRILKRSGQALPGILKEELEQTGPKELKVIINADVSGSAEAVEEAIKDLGNAEVKISIVYMVSVGEVTESDISIAIGANGTLLYAGSD